MGQQEFYGLLLAHYAIRGLMHEAALKAGADPDELSFVHAVRVVRRKMPLYAALPPRLRASYREAVLDEILEERVVSSRGRTNPRAVKQKVGKFPIRHRQKCAPSTFRIIYANHIVVIK